MRSFYGNCSEPVILMHGGAGSQDPSGSAVGTATAALRSCLRRAIEGSHASADTPEPEMAGLVFRSIFEMEADPMFNAGYGAALQGDGVPRLSAGWMVGETQRFSGVVLAHDIHHPSILASQLQGASSRVLGPPGLERMIRDLAMPRQDPTTKERRERWQNTPKEVTFDTVGAVGRGASGGLLAGTSTGGRGGELPGRVSDCCTVAGTYATSFLAVSLTGIGEQIVDHGVAVRLETRVRDGMSLRDASDRCLLEAQSMGHEYGWIALTSQGDWAVCHTTPFMTFLVATATGRILLESK